MDRLQNIVVSAVFTVATLALPLAGNATESGSETYLLGSRDSMAGALPPPGTYLNNDFVFYSADTSLIAIGGAAVVGPSLKAAIYKFNLTHVTEKEMLGGALAFNINLPVAKVRLTATGDLTNGLTGNLKDSQTGFGDLTVTPIIGWKNENLYSSLALQFFLPTGNYNTAAVNASSRTFDVLSIGKNRFAFDPTYSLTHLNPETGLELTGAFGVTFSAINTATDYQTAPEAHFEGTVAQHFKNRVVAGLTGYAYHQIGDDSGSGADSIRAVTGAKSLQASVYGLGPVVTYSTKIGTSPVNFKLKYIQEFGGKRRFEGQKLWLTAGITF